MRIYAVADIHGKQDKIARIHQVISELKPDALVVAGDITAYVNSDAVIHQFNQMAVPVLAIRGNTDMKKVDRLLDCYPNTSSLHLKEQIFGGLKFVGISGTIPVPFSSRLGWREQKIINTLATLVDHDSVLVVHSPPRKVLDHALGRFHAGCRRLYQLIVQRQPRLVLCGHIHECPGIATIGQTTVVNCNVARTGRGAVVDFEPDGPLRAKML